MDCLVCKHIKETGWNGLSGEFHCADSRRAGVVGCHVNWTGLARVHTVCCHRTFSTDGTERYFHGSQVARLSRCPTDDEMALRPKPLALTAGVWHHAPPDGQPWRPDDTEKDETL